jgi:hypothetical protein
VYNLQWFIRNSLHRLNCKIITLNWKEIVHVNLVSGRFYWDQEANISEFTKLGLLYDRVQWQSNELRIVQSCKNILFWIWWQCAVIIQKCSYTLHFLCWWISYCLCNFTLIQQIDYLFCKIHMVKRNFFSNSPLESNNSLSKERSKINLDRCHIPLSKETLVFLGLSSHVLKWAHGRKKVYRSASSPLAVQPWELCLRGVINAGIPALGGWDRKIRSSRSCYRARPCLNNNKPLEWKVKWTSLSGPRPGRMTAERRFRTLQKQNECLRKWLLIKKLISLHLSAKFIQNVLTQISSLFCVGFYFRDRVSQCHPVLNLWAQVICPH